MLARQNLHGFALWTGSASLISGGQRDSDLAYGKIRPRFCNTLNPMSAPQSPLIPMPLLSPQNARKFLRKTPEQKMLSFRFFARRCLARLSYLPIRACLSISPADSVAFWWSYLPSDFHVERSLRDYWGDDIGELRFLWRVLGTDSTFIDIGAYHGLFTVLAAKKIGGRGRVVAFEPSKRERRRLRLHLRMNNISSVTLEPFAVASGTGKADLFTVLSGYTSMNSLRPPNIQYSVEPVQVETIGFDEYVSARSIQRIDLLKLDTEGCELEVLGGCRQVLTSIRPIIICEVLDWVTRPWGYAARDIVSHVQGYDYKWFDFRPDGSLFEHVVKDAYPEVKNYLAVPSERLPAIQEWLH